MKAGKIAAMVIVALAIACVAFVLVRAAGAEAGMTFAAVPAPAGIAASTDPAAIVRGAYLVHGRPTAANATARPIA